MAGISQAQFETYRDEYRRSKEIKTKAHIQWGEMYTAYGMGDYMSTIEAVLPWVSYHNSSTLGRVSAQLPKVNELVRQLVALTTIRNPDFSVESENPWNEAIAEVLEHTFKPERRRMGWNPKMERVHLSGMLTGSGWTKVGHSSRYMYGQPAYAEKLPRKLDFPNSEDDFPYGDLTEYTDPTISTDGANFIHVPSYDLYTNPDAVYSEDIRRFYHRYRRPVIDIMHDDRYNLDARRQIRGKLQDEDILQRMERRFMQSAGEDFAVGELVEVFSMSGREFFIFSEEADAPLTDWIPYPYKLDSPYNQYVPLPHPMSLWGIPWALLIKDQARSINVLREIVVDAISRDGKKVVLYDSQMLAGNDTIQDLNNAYNNQMVPVQGMKDANRGPMFEIIDMGGANPDTLRLLEMIESDIGQTSGLTPPSRNQANTKQTATEVSTRQQAQNTGTDAIVRKTEDFQEELAHKLMMLQLEEWPEEKLVRVIGSNPNLAFWVPLERERVLESPFTLKVVVGSIENQDKATRRRQILDLVPRVTELYQMIVQQQQLEAQGVFGPVDFTAVLEDLVSEFDTSFKNKWLKQRDPAQLYIRLIKQHGIIPQGATQQLLDQVRGILNSQIVQLNGLGQEQGSALGAPPNGLPQPGPGAPTPGFEQRANEAAPVQPVFGRTIPDTSAFQSGRQLSEVAGAGR